MAGKPIADSGPQRPADSPPGVPASKAADGVAGERSGPLQVRRLSKDDGRALIVYSRRASEHG